jgi:hypothetical protein
MKNTMERSLTLEASKNSALPHMLKTLMQVSLMQGLNLVVSLAMIPKAKGFGFIGLTNKKSLLSRMLSLMEMTYSQKTNP